MSRLPILGAAAAFIIGCDGDAALKSSTIVRDSAGVRIVETAGDLWSTPPRWVISGEPLVRIGEADGEDAYLFSGVRGIAPLSDGRFVVANGGDQSLRWYDASGRFLFRRGGPGEGPGEFTQIGQITALDGDSIVAVDWGAYRFVIYGPDGGVGETTRIEGLLAPPGRMHRARDGSWVLGTSGFSSSQMRGSRTPGRYRFESPILRISRNAFDVDTIGMHPGAEIEVRPIGGGLAFESAPFGHRLSYAVFDDQVVVGTGDRLQFDIYSLAGELVRSVRAPDVNLQLTPEIADAYTAHMRKLIAEAPPEERVIRESRLAELNLPETVPAYSSVLVDARGNVWVGEYRFDSSPPQQYLVFNSEGHFLGRATVPPSFRVMEIGEDRIWGQLRDDLGVESVAVYELASK